MNIVRIAIAGDGGGAGRHAIAAHATPGRSAGAADRGIGALALRTQQIIAHESGVTAASADPLGGSDVHRES